MEIYYFGTNGEKVGPVTKKGLINLAKVGAITEQTVFEVDGQKVKGKHIKNLRPIFEERKQGESDPTAASADLEETMIPPPITGESPSQLPPENTGNDTTSGDEIYKTADIGFSLPDDGAKSTSKRKFQTPFVKKYQERKRTKESDSAERRPRVFTKFRWCYRFVTIFLHIVFVIGMLIFITAYFQANSLRHRGEQGKRDFHEKLDKFMRAETSQALGAILDLAKTDSEKDKDLKFWEKYEKLGFEKSEYEDMLGKIESQMQELYDKVMVDLIDGTGRKPDYPKFEDQGKMIDGFLDNNVDRSLAVFDTIESARNYWKQIWERFDEMITEGNVKARICRIYLFGILVSYLNLLLLYYFMASVVYSAEENHKTKILLEEALKSKKEQDVNGTGDMP